MPRHNSNSSRVDRNESERNRRMYMRNLCSRLSLLVPAPPSKFSLHALLDHATAHVRELQQRIKTLTQRKQLLDVTMDETAGIGDDMNGGGPTTPTITVRDMGSRLEVLLISGLNKKFMLCEVIGVLEEEAAQVVTVNHSVVGGRIFYSIYSEPVFSRIGIDTSRVHERLQGLIF